MFVGVGLKATRGYVCLNGFVVVFIGGIPVARSSFIHFYTVINKTFYILHTF